MKVGWMKVVGKFTKLYKQAENTFNINHNIAVQNTIFQISKRIRVPNFFWDFTASYLSIYFIRVHLFQINACLQWQLGILHHNLQHLQFWSSSFFFFFCIPARHWIFSSWGIIYKLRINLIILGLFLETKKHNTTIHRINGIISLD